MRNFPKRAWWRRIDRLIDQATEIDPGPLSDAQARFMTPRQRYDARNRHGDCQVLLEDAYRLRDTLGTFR